MGERRLVSNEIYWEWIQHDISSLKSKISMFLLSLRNPCDARSSLFIQVVLPMAFLSRQHHPPTSSCLSLQDAAGESHQLREAGHPGSIRTQSQRHPWQLVGTAWHGRRMPGCTACIRRWWSSWWLVLSIRTCRGIVPSKVPNKKITCRCWAKLCQVVSPPLTHGFCCHQWHPGQDVYRKAREELGRMPGMKPGVLERWLVGATIRWNWRPVEFGFQCMSNHVDTWHEHTWTRYVYVYKYINYAYIYIHTVLHGSSLGQIRTCRWRVRQHARCWQVQIGWQP